MDVAALITWILTAGGGFFLLATWIRNGGARSQSGGNSHFPPALIFGHFALAAIGLIVWIIYVVSDTRALAWTAFGLLVPVALLGLAMFVRWIPTYRARQAVPVGGSSAPSDTGPAERHFPVVVVGAHGVLAVVTVVLVLLAALKIGS
ncbi:MAG: hypothetical protein ACJ74U_03830 [Jatrophihabitantaceae bacterium]